MTLFFWPETPQYFSLNVVIFTCLLDLLPSSLQRSYVTCRLWEENGFRYGKYYFIWWVDWTCRLNYANICAVNQGPVQHPWSPSETQDSVTAPWCCSLTVPWWCVDTALTNVFDVGGLEFVLFVCLRVTGVLRFLIACYTVIHNLMYLTLISPCPYLKVVFFFWPPDRLWIFVHS